MKMGIIKTLSQTIFLAVTIMFCGLVNAQSPAWERINPIPVESNIKDSQILPNGRVVAVGSGATFMHSDDFGENWEVLYNPADILFNRSLNAVCFADQNTGYALGNYFTIIKTEDGGLSWTDHSTPTSQSSDKYHSPFFHHPDTGFIIENSNRLLQTTNGGLSWDIFFDPDTLSISNIQFHNHQDGYMRAWSSTRNYALKTSDGGASWTLVKITIPLDDFDLGPVYFLNPDTALAGGDVGDFSGHENFIFKSNDGGINWYQVYNDYSTAISQFNFVNSDTGYSMGWVVWYSNNLLRTLDGGENWEIMTTNLGIWTLSSMNMLESGNGLCFGSNGQVVKVEDHGESWEFLSSLFLYKFDIEYCHILGDSSIIASKSGGAGGVLEYGTIQSDDCGRSWYDQDAYNGKVLSIEYLNDTLGFYCGTGDWAGQANIFYKTINGGNSWEVIDLLPYEIDPIKVEFINQDTGFLGGFRYEEQGFSLYRTTDGGENWIGLSHNLFNQVHTHLDFDVCNDTSIIITAFFDPGFSKNRLLTSRDMGETWHYDTLDFSAPFFWQIHFVNPDTGFLLGFHQMLRTINGGQDWYAVNFPLFNALNDETVYSFANDFVGYVFVRSSYPEHVSALYKTIDAGESWFEIDVPTTVQLYSLGFFSEDEGIATGTLGTIFRTSSGGMVKIPERKLEQKSELHVYPNPSSGIIQIDIPTENTNGIIQVFNLNGKLVYSGYCRNQSKVSLHLDLPEGIYIVRVVGGGTQKSAKLIMVNP